MRGIRWSEIVPTDKKKVIIIAAGKSLESFNFNRLEEVRRDTAIITVNDVGKIVHFADYWFTLDPWGLNGPQLPTKKFQGQLWAAVPDTFGRSDAPSRQHAITPDRRLNFLHRIASNNFMGIVSDNCMLPRLCEDPSCISTGNSGYGALNFAYHLNPKKILLLGLDAGDGYFYTKQKKNRNLSHLPKLFAGTLPQLEKKGIKVMNGSPESKIDCFKKCEPLTGIKWIKHNE